MLAGRFLVLARSGVAARDPPGQTDDRPGAGEAGEQLVRAMLLDDRADYDPASVVGRRCEQAAAADQRCARACSSADIAKVADETGASVLVVAIAQVDAAQLLAWDRDARAANMKMRVCPARRRSLLVRSSWAISPR